MTLVRCLLAFAVAFAAGPAVAVRLDPNGLGQALIYPYYTARVVDGNAWTTALSLTNTRAKPKAVKLRFREGRHGVASREPFHGRSDGRSEIGRSRVRA